MQLRIRQPDGRTKLVPLEEGKTLKLGSDPGADIVLDGPGISPMHCGILAQKGSVQVGASKSARQVEVNGSSVAKAQLEEGDQIRIGEVRIALVSDNVKSTEPAATPAGDDDLGLAPMDDDELGLAPLEDEPQPQKSTSSSSSPAEDDFGLAPLEEESASKSAGAADDDFGLAPLGGEQPQVAPPADGDDFGLAPLEGEPKKVEPPAGGDDFGLAPLDSESKQVEPPAEGDAFGLSPIGDEAAAAPIELGGADELGGEAPLTLGPAAEAGGPIELGPSEAAEPMGLDPLGSEPLGGGLDNLSSPAPLPDAPAGGPVPGTLPPPAAGLDDLGSPGAAGVLPPATAGRAIKPPSRLERFSKLMSSRPVKIGGGVLGTIAAIGFLTFVIANLPTAEDRFLEAQEEFRAGRYAQAVEKYDDFLASHGNHLYADDARVGRAMATLIPVVKQGSDWSASLQTAEGVVSELKGLRQHPVAQQHLGELLPQIATELVGRAQTAAESREAERLRSALAEAQRALVLLKQNVPPKVLAESGSVALNVQVHRLSRELEQSKALRTAVQQIEQAAADNKPGEAYAARESLLAAHPNLKGRLALARAMTEVTELERRAVQFDAASQPPQEANKQTLVQHVATFASQSAAKDAADSGKLVLVRSFPHGALYAVDSGSGKLRWRRFIGFGGEVLPLKDQGGAVVVDTAQSALIRLSDEGRVVWQQPLKGQAAAPVLARNKLLLPTDQGKLLVYDLESGTQTGAYTFAQPLSVPPQVSGDGTLCYQIVDHSHLFVLDLSQQRAAAAMFLGHLSGSITQPPLELGKYLLVVEQDGLDASNLHVLSVEDELRRVISLPVPGHIVSQPLLQGEQLFVSTQDGGIYTFQYAEADNQRPLRPGAEVPPTVGPATANYLQIVDGKLWVAGNGLRVFATTARGGRLPLEQTLFAADRFTQPIHSAGSTAIHSRSEKNATGQTVTAWSVDSGETSWQTRVAFPIAVSPDEDGLMVAGSGGEVFQLSADAAGQSSQVPQPLASDVALQAPLVGARIYQLDGATVVTAPGASDLVIYRPGEEPPLRGISLPGPLGPQQDAEGGVLASAMQGGPVFLLDGAAGAPAAAPFLPPLVVGDLPQWRGPVAAAGGWIASDRQTAYRLVLADGRLNQDHKLTLESPIVSNLARSGGLVWGIDARNLLLGLDQSDLSLKATVPLEAPALWGPANVADLVLVGLSDGRLLAFKDASEPVWEAQGTREQITGAAPLGGQLVFVTAGGSIFAVDAASGAAAGKPFQTGQPLAGVPLEVGGRLLVSTADGSLLSLPPPGQLLLQAAQ